MNIEVEVGPHLFNVLQGIDMILMIWMTTNTVTKIFK